MRRRVSARLPVKQSFSSFPGIFEDEQSNDGNDDGNNKQNQFKIAEFQKLSSGNFALSFDFFFHGDLSVDVLLTVGFAAIEAKFYFCHGNINILKRYGWMINIVHKVINCIRNKNEFVITCQIV